VTERECRPDPLGSAAAFPAARSNTHDRTRCPQEDQIKFPPGWNFHLHGLATVPYLVPDALGADKKRRRYTEVALARLADCHGSEAVAAQAEAFGPKAAEAIRSLLGTDPLVPRAVKIPKPGPWAPRWSCRKSSSRAARALPAEAIAAHHLLALGTPEAARHSPFYQELLHTINPTAP
jgi:hypothetical protein